MIDKWISKLGLGAWTIKTKSIPKESVMYPNDCVANERFFVGITANQNTLEGIIYHDRPLTEEDIVHELLHVKYPDWSEDQVNIETEKLLKENKDE